MKRALFFEKEQKILTPYLISFLNILHQNKPLHDFHKRRQCLMFELNIVLEYALPSQILLRKRFHHKTF